MCGIVGIVDPHAAITLRESLVRGMLRALWRRGPDAQALQSDGPLTLGTARLAIVDPQHAHQPMARPGPDGRTHLLAYNGEIYNHQELRKKLQRQGFEFSTQSDTEVVLAAHAAWGLGALQKLDGMFAYALWDAHARELLLVRDRLGIKPLYWTRKGQGIAFASEPKALLALSGGRGKPDFAGLAEIFSLGAAFPAGGGVGDRTAFHGISALPAAHWLRWRHGQMQVQRWWALLDDVGQPFASREEASAALEDAFAASVRAARMGDAEVGASLSGGLDSSLLTAELVAQSDHPVVAATITYRQDHSDGDALAAVQLAEHLALIHPGRLEHHWTWLPEPTWLADVDTLVRAFDEPCWEPRKLGMLANYRTLRGAGCKVALSGEGADELFFGYYPRFLGWRDPPPAMASVADFSAAWREKRRGLAGLFAPAVASGALKLADLESSADEATDTWLRPYWQDPADRVRAVQAWYTHTFLHILLADNDRFGMHWSIEARFPFLTQAMLKTALALPPQWNFPGEQGFPDKAMERLLGPGRLPLSIWRHRVKAPMPTPGSLRYHLGLADRLEQEVALAPEGVWTLFDKGYVAKMIADFRATVRPMLDTDPDAGEAVSKYNPRLPVRTVHLFGVLTTLRWWALYIES